jgi:hypothetical protein
MDHRRRVGELPRPRREEPFRTGTPVDTGITEHEGWLSSADTPTATGLQCVLMRGARRPTCSASSAWRSSPESEVEWQRRGDGDGESCGSVEVVNEPEPHSLQAPAPSLPADTSRSTVPLAPGGSSMMDTTLGCTCKSLALVVDNSFGCGAQGRGTTI